MIKRRKEYGNELTEQIEKGIEIKDLLSHERLSITVRNEAPAFINYLFPPKEMKKEKPELPVLEKLITMSLIPDEEQFEKYKLYQLSRNAANIFSSPSSKLHEMLQKDNSRRYFKSLRNFIYDKNHRNPMFAGHFQRMFEMALRKSGDALLDKEAYDDEFKQSFIPKLIKNSDLLPYRELLSAIMSEFTEYFPDAINETLRYAAISTLNIDRMVELDQSFNHTSKNIYSRSSNEDEREKFIQDTQPQNCKTKPIRIPYFILNPLKFNYQSNPIPDDDAFITKLKDTLKFNDLTITDLTHQSEKIDSGNSIWINFALNLIYAVKNAYEMDIDNVLQAKVDQNDKEGEDIIRCLLVCGMYADSNSSLSYTSFNLLFNLINKPHMDSDGIYDDKYILNLDPPEIVKEFAEHFVFDPYSVSETMISALLIFWNHHYTNLESNKGKEIKRKEIPGYKSEKGVTPLQLLLPTILTEPIFSSKLNNIFMRIISNMEQEIIDTINEEKNYLNGDKKDEFESNEDRCFKIDSIWYELLTYKFKLLPSDEEKEITLINALEQLLPLPTTDAFYYEPPKSEEDTEDNPPESEDDTDDKSIPKFRAPTNPVFFMLSNIINHGAFFTYKKGVEFRQLFTESFDIDWALNSFEYYHIIDKVKKNLVSLKYNNGSRKKLDRTFSNSLKTESDDEENDNKEEGGEED